MKNRCKFFRILYFTVLAAFLAVGAELAVRLSVMQDGMDFYKNIGAAGQGGLSDEQCGRLSDLQDAPENVQDIDVTDGLRNGQDTSVSEHSGNVQDIDVTDSSVRIQMRRMYLRMCRIHQYLKKMSGTDLWNYRQRFLICPNGMRIWRHGFRFRAQW